MDNEILEYLGLNYQSFKKIPIKVDLVPTTISKQNNFEVLPKIIQNLWAQNQTILDEAFAPYTISWEDDRFTAYFSSDQVDITVAVLHDELHMKLFPSKNMTFEGGVLDLPVFEVEYYIEDIPYNISNNDIAHSILKKQNQYEGEFLFDMLNKALRSQRNKLEKNITKESLSEALELIERENERVYHTLTNTRSFASLRQEIHNDDFMGTKVLNFSPDGRVHKTRTYFMGNPLLVGRVAKTNNCQIDIKEKEDTFDISCLLRMGCVVLNRSLISVIES